MRYGASKQIQISGQLCDSDLKRLQRKTRSATIGPTTTYYAGVTAPIIGGSMAMVVATSFGNLGLAEAWVNLIAALAAALAGIVWYLIFMRWSYRHTAGRAAEIDLETHLTLTEEALVVLRGDVETRIAWPAVTSLQQGRKHMIVQFTGADPLIIPDKWFRKDKAARKAFSEFISRSISKCREPDDSEARDMSPVSGSYAPVS